MIYVSCPIVSVRCRADCGGILNQSFKFLAMVEHSP
jgi:hypothetical protein